MLNLKINVVNEIKFLRIIVCGKLCNENLGPRKTSMNPVKNLALYISQFLTKHKAQLKAEITNQISL